MSVNSFVPRVQRVVVQLYEVKEGQHGKFTANMKNFTKPADIVEMEVIDNHRLLCSFSHMPGYEMYFDTIGLKNDECIVNEIARLISDLIINKVNCSVFRFAAIRELDLHFLHNVFVHEIENFMKPLNNSVQKIYLDYHDIRKYDLVNLINSQEGINVPPSKRKTVRKRRSGKEFHTTRDLFNWLNKEFVYAWSIGRGHDLFELEIHFTSGEETHAVKLTLIQIYLSKLELNMKANLNVFLQFNNRKSRRKPFSSLITDCMQEHVNNKNEQNLFLFDIPIFKAGVPIVKDMVKLAEDAYIGIQNNKLHNTDELGRSHLTAYGSIAEPSQKFIVNALYGQRITPKPTATPGSSFPKQTNFSRGKFNPADKVQEDLTLQDLNTLSYWYCKIEEQFSIVIKTMENYYMHAYKLKTAKIRSEIVGLFNSYGLEAPTDALPSFANVQHSLDHFHAYQQAIEDFRQIFKDIEKSKFAKNLEVYLKTKNYELLREISRFKDMQMEKCHTNLISTISDLISNMEFHNTESNTTQHERLIQETHYNTPSTVDNNHDGNYTVANNSINNNETYTTFITNTIDSNHTFDL